jgi:ABC-type amino acid transport substrate-binding protein
VQRLITQTILLFLLTVFLNTESHASSVYHIGTIQIEKKWSDIYTKVAEEIFTEAGLRVRTTLLPYARVKKGLVDGSVDASIMFWSDELKSSSNKIGKIRTKSVFIVGKKGTSIDSLKHLRTKSIGIQRGTHYFTKEQSKSIKHKTYTHSYEQNIRMLMNDRVDLIIGSGSSIYNIAKKLGYSTKDFGTPFVLSSKESWLITSKRSKVDTSRLKKSYEKLTKLKKIDEIINNTRTSKPLN